MSFKALHISLFMNDSIKIDLPYIAFHDCSYLVMCITGGKRACSWPGIRRNYTKQNTSLLCGFTAAVSSVSYTLCLLLMQEKLDVRQMMMLDWN